MLYVLLFEQCADDTIHMGLVVPLCYSATAIIVLTTLKFPFCRQNSKIIHQIYYIDAISCRTNHEKINSVDPYRTATHCEKYISLYIIIDDTRDSFNYSTSVEKTSNIVLSEKHCAKLK